MDISLIATCITIPPIIMVQWKMGVSPIGSVTFQISRHFPQNHDYGRKSIYLIYPPTQYSSHHRDYSMLRLGNPKLNLHRTDYETGKGWPKVCKQNGLAIRSHPCKPSSWLASWLGGRSKIWSSPVFSHPTVSCRSLTQQKSQDSMPCEQWQLWGIHKSNEFVRKYKVCIAKSWKNTAKPIWKYR